MAAALAAAKAAALRDGLVIPAHPLALTAERTLDERRQRARARYYLDAGAGGIAVAVHTTQFAVHEPARGLLRPVLEIASEEMAAHPRSAEIVRVAGIVGDTRQAVAEAELAASLGYDIALVSPLGARDEDDLLKRCAAVGEVMPVFGFYLQEAVGGRHLSRQFWRRLADQPSTVGVKAAPFDRYRTLELVRGVVDSDRGDEVALYTGNDDNIVADLLGWFDITTGERTVRRRFVGGLLGHWAVWTRSAVSLLAEVKRARGGVPLAGERAMARAAAVTEANAAVFDVQGGFAGVIAGVHDVLHRQGLLAGTWCLDPDETLSPGQAALITDIIGRDPELRAEAGFIAEHLDRWLR